MIDKKTRVLLTDIMQDNFTDLDILREKPWVYRYNKKLLIIYPVSRGEHPSFLKDMTKLITNFWGIFENLQFLSIADYRDKKAFDKLMQQVLIFSADENYKKFNKSVENFICRWGFAVKERKKIKLKHNKRYCKKILDAMNPDEFIYCLFLLIVFNYDIVKKNLLNFLEIFSLEQKPSGKFSNPGQTLTTSEIFDRIPEFSVKPFSKEALDTLEELNTMLSSKL